MLPPSPMVFFCVFSFVFLISFFSLLFLCFLFHALSTCVWPRVKGKVASCDLAKLRSFFNRVLIFLAQLVGCVCLLSLWDTFQYGWCTQFGTVLSNFVFNRLLIFRAQLVISGLLSSGDSPQYTGQTSLGHVL